VGKSTLLNAVLGERIAITSHHPQTTRDRIAGILTDGDAQIVFLDTPGFHRARNKLGERMNDLAAAAASDCDVAIFMTDTGPSPASAPSDADRAVLDGIPANKKTILVINKVDRVHPRSLLFPLLEAYGKLRDFAAVVPVSAKTESGLDRVIAEVEKLLPSGEALFADDEISDKPVRFFVAEFVREQVLKRTREEVPHGVAVTVESFEEGKKVVRIAVTIHVAKESHKAILIGDGGKMLRSIGIDARKRAEKLVGQKVHLETWVRATPKWFDDPARLADLGYTDDAPRKKTKKRKAS
jgi:GTP-binding protein Era